MTSNELSKLFKTIKKLEAAKMGCVKLMTDGILPEQSVDIPAIDQVVTDLCFEYEKEFKKKQNI